MSTVKPVIHCDDCGLECGRPMAPLRGRGRGRNVDPDRNQRHASHSLHTGGVTGSIPVAPTNINDLATHQRNSLEENRSFCRKTANSLLTKLSTKRVG
jgi:hypothetical protein